MDDVLEIEWSSKTQAHLLEASCSLFPKDRRLSPVELKGIAMGMLEFGAMVLCTANGMTTDDDVFRYTLAMLAREAVEGRIKAIQTEAN